METAIKGRISENYDVLKLHKSLELGSISQCFSLHGMDPVGLYMKTMHSEFISCFSKPS